MSCLAALMIFMSERAGLPSYKQGLAIQKDDLKVFTWYSHPEQFEQKTFLVEYFAIGKKKEDLCKAFGKECSLVTLKNFKIQGTCDDDDTVFTAEGKIVP